MKRLTLLILGSTLFASNALAEMKKYNVEVHFKDLTRFEGQFDYDATTQQVINLQGILIDEQMFTEALIKYQLQAKNDGKGGITASAYLLNTTDINPTVSSAEKTNEAALNAFVSINFNAADPTLGPTDFGQIEYISCVPGSLMGTSNPSVDDCMYQLTGHDPELSMPLPAGSPITFTETINPVENEQSISDCLFDWAENNYSSLFAPVQGSAASSNLPPYYFRHYPATRSYLGITSALNNAADHNHVYYLGPNNNLMDVGHTYEWLQKANCLYLQNQ